jgi:hypothetical protein
MRYLISLSVLIHSLSTLSPSIILIQVLLLLQVLETNRAEESHGHVHRMYFMGPNTFSEPWHLPHTPPEEITEIVYVYWL